MGSTTAVGEAPLTYFSVGMWSGERRRPKRILILPTTFVFLIDYNDGRQTSAKANNSQVLQQLKKSSPFRSMFYEKSCCVFAFEVPHDGVCGLDYSNPLCQHGRVVLEVHGVRKREFRTVDAARSFYVQNLMNGNGLSGSQCSLSLHEPTRKNCQAGSCANVTEGRPAWPASPSANAELPNARRARVSLFKGLEHVPPSAQSAGHHPSAAPSNAPCAQALPSDISATLALSCTEHTIRGTTAAVPQGEHSRDVPLQVLRGEAQGSLSSGTVVSRNLLQPAGDASAACESRVVTAHPHLGKNLVKQCSCTELLHGGAASNSPGPSTGTGGQLPPGAPAGDTHFVAHPPCSSFWPFSTTSPPRSPSCRGPLPQSPLKPGGVGRDVATVHALSHHPPPSPRAPSLQPQPSWPSVHTWDIPTGVYEYRTVIFKFIHPDIPDMLQPVVQSNERLLKMYESGLPTWATILPAYGFYYRPWLRTVTWLLFYAFSIFSLACGFYDLYKNLPGLQLLLQRVMASAWLPPASILRWLDEHAQLRLSLLLTYLFGKSQAFVLVMRWLGNVARGLRVACSPAIDAAAPVLAAVVQGGRLMGQQAWQALAGVWLGVGSLLYAILAPLVQLGADLWGGVVGVLAPAAMFLYSLIAGPATWLLACWGHLRAAGSVLWKGLGQAGKGMAAGAAAVKAGASMRRAVQGAVTGEVGSQVSWLYVIPADIFDLVQTSALKVFKGVQAVAKFIMQMCDTTWRHRQTLQKRAERNWAGVRRRAAAWMSLPGRGARALTSQVLNLIKALLQALLPLPVRPPEDPHHAAQGESDAVEGHSGVNPLQAQPGRAAAGSPPHGEGRPLEAASGAKAAQGTDSQNQAATVQGTSSCGGGTSPDGTAGRVSKEGCRQQHGLAVTGKAGLGGQEYGSPGSGVGGELRHRRRDGVAVGGC